MERVTGPRLPSFRLPPGLPQNLENYRTGFEDPLPRIPDPEDSRAPPSRRKSRGSSPDAAAEPRFREVSRPGTRENSNVVLGVRAVGDSASSSNAGSEPLWLVSFADDDDRELTTSAVGDALKRGDIDRNTIVWREGQPDWLPIEEVPELTALLPSATLRASAPPKPRKSLPPPLPAPAAAIAPADVEEAPESVQPDSADDHDPLALSPGTLGVAQRRGLPAAPPAPKRPAAMEPEDEEPAPSSETPSLLSLAGPAKVDAPRIDEEILNLGAPSPVGLGPPTIDLTSLTASPAEPEPEPPTAPSPDRRAARTPSEAKEVESAAARPTTPPMSARKKKSSGILPWVAIAVSAFAVWFTTLRGGGSEKPPTPEPVAPAPAPQAAVPPPATTEPTPPAVPTSSAPPVTSAVAVSPSATTAASAVTPAAPQPTTPATVAPGAATTPPKPTALPVQPAATAKPAPAATTAAAPTAAAPTAAAAPQEPAVEGEPFNVAAAQAALSTAAAQAAGCHQEGDPTGVASVRVTFSNSGAASRATIEGPPLAGTPTGSCIAAAMRTAKVPPFGGDRVSVIKRVVIQ